MARMTNARRESGPMLPDAWFEDGDGDNPLTDKEKAYLQRVRDESKAWRESPQGQAFYKAARERAASRGPNKEKLSAIQVARALLAKIIGRAPRRFP